MMKATLQILKSAGAAKMLLILALLFSAKAPLSAQEMWGAASSNYAGQMGMDLNPASMVAAPYRWELHLLSMDAAAVNNFMYLKKGSRLVPNTLQGKSLGDSAFGDRSGSQKDKFFYTSVFLKYPAFIYSGKKWAYGFHVSTRAEISARNVPYHLAKFIKEGFTYDTLQNIDFSGSNIRATVNTWHEITASAGTVIYDSPESFITAAATLKYNYGLNALYLKMDNFDYNSTNDSLLVVYDLDAQYGHTMSGNGNEAGNPFTDKKGSGWSVDLGMEYYRNRNESFYNPCSRDRKVKPYDYRVGASLIDFGYINYNTNTSTYAFKDASTNWYGFDTVDFQNLDHSDTLFGDQFYGQAMAAENGSSFKMMTPAALSVQVDYCIMPRLFVNAAVLQRIPLGPYAIRRTNQIAITPRFETRRFEVALPFSMYDFFKPRLGIAMRLGPLTLGTDMLGPLVGITDSYGADFYFGLTFKNPGKCKRGSAKVKGKNNIENCLSPK